MKIAILEDDADQAAVVASTLKAAGHICTTFALAKLLISRIRQETYDLVILDWNLPDMSAIQVLEWMGQGLERTPPVLMLTSRSSQADIVAGLNAGADDYVVKPADEHVLLARVNAILRRSYPADWGNRLETIGDLVFDRLQERVTVRGEEVSLTAKEFALAQMFFRNLNRALSRTYLLETVWGRNPDLMTRTLDAHVSRIRSKLGLRPENGFRLGPVYSYGYRLETLQEPDPQSERHP